MTFYCFSASAKSKNSLARKTYLSYSQFSPPAWNGFGSQKRRWYHRPSKNWERSALISCILLLFYWSNSPARVSINTYYWSSTIARVSIQTFYAIEGQYVFVGGFLQKVLPSAKLVYFWYETNQMISFGEADDQQIFKSIFVSSCFCRLCNCNSYRHGITKLWTRVVVEISGIFKVSFKITWLVSKLRIDKV